MRFIGRVPTSADQRTAFESHAGAIVLNNAGDILAYGAVLRPRKTGKIRTAEGSRTKAAIGASHYGLGVKVSSDGDITFYEDGKLFLKA